MATGTHNRWFTGNINTAGDILHLSRDEIDGAFANAASRALRIDKDRERRERREWNREHGPKVTEKRRRLAREQNWQGFSQVEAHKKPKKSNSTKSLSPFAASMPDIHSPSKRSQKRRRGKGVDKKNPGNNKTESVAGITFESTPNESGEKSFESFLEREALNVVVEREGYLEQLRHFLRKHENHGALPRKELKAWEKKLWKLIEQIRASTLTCILSISKWTNCFVNPQAFMFRGQGQDNIDYLLSIFSGLDFLELRPKVIQVLSSRNRLGGGEFSMIRNPLVQLEEPHHLELEAIKILKRQEKAFGRFEETYTRCKWCGLVPEPNKYGGQSLVSCAGNYCGRAKYCKFCVGANCGGVQGYNAIRVAKSWVCFVCVDTKLSIEREKKKQAQQFARQVLVRKKQKEKQKELEQRLLREQSKVNVKRRKQASKYLLKRVKQAQAHLNRQRKARRSLVALGKQCLAHLENQRQAKQILLRKANDAFKECDEMLSLLLAAETGLPEPATKPPLLRPLTPGKASSLDLFELEEQAQKNENTETEKEATLKVVSEDAWLAFGERVDLRFALKVVHFEICLVRVKSTERNAEIVNVTVFLPSTQTVIVKTLMHKSQVARNKRNNDLLFVLRQLAHGQIQKDASAYLLERAEKAKFLFNHNKYQHGLQMDLIQIGAKAKLDHKNQYDAFKWLKWKAEFTNQHLARQIQARKDLRWLARRAQKQQTKQLEVQGLLVHKSAQVQKHLMKQQRIRWELVSRANQVKIHLFAQQRQRSELKEIAQNAMAK